MKPDVEAKVSEALAKLWEPIAGKIGINYIVINDIDDRKRLADETLHFDDDRWEYLVEAIECGVGAVAQIWSTSQDIRISLEGVKRFLITIERKSYEEDDEIDTSEIEGMTREEAIEYLSELDEISPFEYAEIEIYIGNHFIHRLIAHEESPEAFHDIISPLIEGLLKTPEVYSSAIKTASIELQRDAETQRELERINKAKKEEEERHLAEFAAEIKPHLLVAAWSGEYR